MYDINDRFLTSGLQSFLDMRVPFYRSPTELEYQFIKIYNRFNVNAESSEKLSETGDIVTGNEFSYQTIHKGSPVFVK